MKAKIIFSLLISLSVYQVFGQMVKVKNDPTHDEKPIHFGFSLGMNFMDYQINQSPYADSNGYYVGIKEFKPGIDIHAIANLRITEFFDLTK